MPWDEQDQHKKDARVAVSEATMDERHRGFDLAAQDTTPKYHRSHFAVVGEGSKSANEAYAQNYALIDWSA